jgi:hypothetical protein
MSISIYYVASRESPLEASEVTLLNKLIEEYAVEDKIAQREKDGVGPNWQSFGVYRNNQRKEPLVVFEGATGLPDNSEEAVWIGLQHWCKLLTQIRLALRGLTWRVHVDGHEILWDESRREYDPSI